MPSEIQQQQIQPLLDVIPTSVLATAKALKTYDKLVKVFIEFAESKHDESVRAAFEKKLKPILTDSGCGRSVVAEITQACFKVRIQLAQPSSEPETKQEEKPNEENIRSSQKQTESSSIENPSTTPSETKPARRTKRSDKSSKHSNDSDDGELADIAVSALDLDHNKEAKVALIKAVSQESRFHLDCTETGSLEIDLKGVYLSLAERELLQGAHLRLKAGVHYGLVGRNGTGKSTLLTAIGEKIIPGLPENIKVLLVSQVSQALVAQDSQDPSVLNVVIQSDAERTRAVKEVRALNRVLEQEQPNEQEARKVTLEIRLRRSRDRLEDARKLTIKRSGARGADARKALITAEKHYQEAENALRNEDLNPPSSDGSTWTHQAVQLLLETQVVLAAVEENTIEARARKILFGLGFSEESIVGPYQNLSGGWRSRASLASALLQSAHVLLLDEPVNYLDLPAVLFVQTFIKEIPHTVVTVSHDREFLDQMTDELILLRKQQLTYFDGNLTEYEKESRKKLKLVQKQQDNLDKKKEKMQKSIQEATKQAKKTGDDKRMRTIKSRQKKLDDRWGLEVNAKGHRFKLNRDFGGYHLTSRAGPEMDKPDQAIRFSFPHPDELRFPGALIHMDRVGVTYPGALKPTLNGITFTIGPGERVALVGPNGHGKTTLLNAMVSTLTPSSGKVERHSKARISIYAQHTIEDLLTSCQSALSCTKPRTKSTTETAIPGTTALSHFLTAANPPNEPSQITESDARGFLAQLGLKGRTADMIPLTGLSGGQLVRLGLAKVMWSAPDLIILDEVTTHLDNDTIEALVDALRCYTGAIILVSHDRYAVKRIIEMAKDPSADSDDENSEDSENDGTNVEVNLKKATKQPGRTYLLKNGQIQLLEKGMDQYTNSVVKAMG